MSKFLRAGGVATGLCCVAFFAANGNSSASEDVVLAGSVIAEKPVTAIQHPTGGIIAEIRRRNGDHVKSGELLARLDDRGIRSNLMQSTASLDELFARKARLEAERDGKGDLSLPPMLADRLAEAGVIAAVERERRLLTSRANMRNAEKKLQQYRIRLIDEEVQGLKAQERAKATERGLVMRELAGVRDLQNQNLVPLQRLLALERDAVRLEGDLNGWLPISLAQARSRIADSELQLMRAERDRQRDIANEISDTEEKIADTVRRKDDFQAQLERAQIVSPQDGIVLSSAFAAAGNPIAPGKDIMLIAPPDEKPSFEARLDARSAARLRVGQPAKLAVLSSAQGAGELAVQLANILPAASDGSGAAREDVTLRFVLAPDAQATLATMPPGTSVRVSIEPVVVRRGFLDLVGVVSKPLDSFEKSLL
jgi:HlyD family secretion protein